MLLSQATLLRLRLRVIWEAETTAVEAGIALRSLTWGGWVLGSPWNVFAVSGTYRHFRDVMPEWAWGLMVLVVGAGHSLAVLSGKTVRRWTALASFLVWTLVCSAYVWSNNRTAAAPTHFVTALASGWVYLRLGEPRRCSPPE